jgi:pimeloyl-ACP methyl ester carboxylesterase
MYRKTICAMLAKALRAPVVLQVHVGEPELEKFRERVDPVSLAAFRWAFGHVDKVLSVGAASAREVEEHYSARDVDRFAHLCYGNNPPSELVDAVRRTDGRLRPIVARSMMRGEGVNQRRAVEEASIPIAIVNGEHDPLIRHSYVSGLHIPNLWDDRVHIMYDAGHAAFRDNPERFNALLLRFAAHVDAWREPVHEMARSA